MQSYTLHCRWRQHPKQKQVDNVEGNKFYLTINQFIQLDHSVQGSLSKYQMFTKIRQQNQGQEKQMINSYLQFRNQSIPGYYLGTTPDLIKMCKQKINLHTPASLHRRHSRTIKLSQDA